MRFNDLLGKKLSNEALYVSTKVKLLELMEFCFTFPYFRLLFQCKISLASYMNPFVCTSNIQTQKLDLLAQCNSRYNVGRMSRRNLLANDMFYVNVNHAKKLSMIVIFELYSMECVEKVRAICHLIP